MTGDAQRPGRAPGTADYQRLVFPGNNVDHFFLKKSIPKTTGRRVGMNRTARNLSKKIGIKKSDLIQSMG
jgi:hypothetical protein